MRRYLSSVPPSDSVVAISAADADVLSEQADAVPSDYVVAISAVDADVLLVGKERSAIPASVVVIGAASFQAHVQPANAASSVERMARTRVAWVERV